MLPSAVLTHPPPPFPSLSQQTLFLHFILIVWFKILSGYLRHVVASRHEARDQLLPDKIPHLFCELRVSTKVSQNCNSTFFSPWKVNLTHLSRLRAGNFWLHRGKCVTVVYVVWPNYPRGFCSIYLLHALYNEGSLPRHDQPQRVSETQWFQSRFLLTQVSCYSSVKGASFRLGNQ